MWGIIYCHIKEKHKIRFKNNVIKVIDYYMLKNYIDYYIQKLFKYIFKSTLKKNQIKRSKIIN